MSCNPYVADAAVAAPVAFLATVILAAVLGAVDADLCRRLVTDAADERKCIGHFFSIFRLAGEVDFDAGAGACRIRALRQRWASWSRT